MTESDTAGQAMQDADDVQSGKEAMMDDEDEAQGSKDALHANEDSPQEHKHSNEER